MKAFLLPVIGMMLPASAALAEPEYQQDDNFSIAVGAGAFTYQSIYKGGETQTSVLPMLDVRWGPVFFKGGELGVHLGGLEEHGIEFSLGLGGDFTGDTEYGDSDELSDLEELDTVITGRFNMRWENKLGQFQLTYATDISNNHDGDFYSLGYSKLFRSGKWSYGPSLEITHNNEEATQYYYGVRADQATVGRSMYTPDASTTYSVGFRAGYNFDKKSSVMGFVSAESYGNEIADSPIIEDDSHVKVGVMYLYRFD